MSVSAQDLTGLPVSPARDCVLHILAATAITDMRSSSFLTRWGFA